MMSVQTDTQSQSTTEIAPVTEEPLEVSEEVYEIMRHASLGMPLIEANVYGAMKGYYLHMGSPSVAEGIAKAKYKGLTQAMVAVRAHTHEALRLMAKLRAERELADPGADIEQVATGWRMLVELSMKKMMAETGRASPKDFAYLASEVREILSASGQFFGKPMEKLVRVNGAVTMNHTGDSGAGSAYSHWGGTEDLGAVTDASFEEITKEDE